MSADKINERPPETFRSITLVGSDWHEILGLRAKYIPRQVGIILTARGTGSLAQRLRDLQVMSGNVDLGMPILVEIVTHFCDEARARRTYSRHFQEAEQHLLVALESMKKAATAYDAGRKGTP